jgi:hypothetical protein
MELIAVNIPRSDISRPHGRRVIRWLNERTDSNTIVGDECRVWLLGGNLWFNGNPDVFEIETKLVNEYEIRRVFVGTGWILEFGFKYTRQAATDFALTNHWNEAYFDDDFLALQFKLAAPWEDLNANC